MFSNTVITYCVQHRHSLVRRRIYIYRSHDFISPRWRRNKRKVHFLKIFLVFQEFISQKNIGKMWIKPEEVLLANALW